MDWRHKMIWISFKKLMMWMFILLLCALIMFNTHIASIGSVLSSVFAIVALVKVIMYLNMVLFYDWEDYDE